MAILDVSEVICDPLFTSSVTLVSMQEGSDSNGNPTWTEIDRKTVKAVVTSDRKVIDRLPEGLNRNGSIVVRVLCELVPQGFQCKGFDRVYYRGKRFVVADAADYTQFGRGFYRLICSPEETGNGSY